MTYYRKRIGDHRIGFELIENTHFWGQNNYENKTFETGIRGLLFSSHHGNKATLLKNCKDDKPLSDYISNLITNDIVNNFIVELSIFDTGSGLASKWLKKNIAEISSKDVIYEAIIDCFGNNSCPIANK